MKAIRQHPDLRRFYWRFEKALRRLLPRPEAKVLAAISGGLDSVTLAALLVEARDAGLCPVVFGHVHHGLRENADRDASFVQELAAAMDVEFTVVRLDLQPLREREGFSLEQAARAGRHETLAREAARLDCDAVAMAHHMDDQAETVLVRILRGVGPGGLGAMAPSVPMPQAATSGGRQVMLIRPLLRFRREAVADFLAELGLSHREDESNRSTDYLRNRVRHELLPQLAAEYNPRLVESLADLARWARLESEPMGAWAQTILQEVLLTRDAGTDHLVLDAAALHAHPDALVTRVLWMAYQKLQGPEATLGSRHIEELLGLLAKLAPPAASGMSGSAGAGTGGGAGGCAGAGTGGGADAGTGGCASCAGERDHGEAHLPGRLRARLAGGMLYLEPHDPRPGP